MLNLTKEEKLVLVFLVASFITGSGVNYYRKTRQDNPIIATPTASTFGKASAFAKASADRSANTRNDALETKININNADFNELIKLKGIGVKTAERIIDYRQRNGPFFCKEDLMKIKGIGKSKFNAIKDNIIAE